MKKLIVRYNSEREFKNYYLRNLYSFLTSREVQVLILLSEGKRQVDIAKLLGKHRQNINSVVKGLLDKKLLVKDERNNIKLTFVFHKQILISYESRSK